MNHGSPLHLHLYRSEHSGFAMQTEGWISVTEKKQEKKKKRRKKKKKKIDNG